MLKFYADEQRRHSWAHSWVPALEVASAKVLTWCRRWSLAPITVTQSRGWLWSEANLDERTITLCRGATWGTVAHEFAHHLDYARRGVSWHDAAMARTVDQVVSTLTEFDYWVGALRQYTARMQEERVKFTIFAQK